MTKAELAKRDLEPLPDPIAPSPPAWLSPNAKKRWLELGPELVRLGTVTHVDAEVLASYCDACARIANITHRYGIVPKDHHIAVQRRNALADILKFGAELGIGAAARTRIEVKKPVDANPLADILSEAKAEAAHRRRKG